MHPYRNFPETSFWKKSVSNVEWSQIFKSMPSKFILDENAPIASAGSCFAQRISTHLQQHDYAYSIYEKAHPFLEKLSAEYGYGVFSCRYGNIYTTRQLKELIEDALGYKERVFVAAKNKEGRYIDLLRPNANKIGFDFGGRSFL